MDCVDNIFQWHHHSRCEMVDQMELNRQHYFQSNLRTNRILINTICVFKNAGSTQNEFFYNTWNIQTVLYLPTDSSFPVTHTLKPQKFEVLLFQFSSTWMKYPFSSQWKKDNWAIRTTSVLGIYSITYLSIENLYRRQTTTYYKSCSYDSYGKTILLLKDGQ